MKEKCKNCEILESGSIIRLDLNGDCIFCGRNLHTQIVLQEPMTHTEKVLEEFDSLYEEHKEILDIPVCCTKEDCLCNKDTVWQHFKSFLSTSIHQALAEEREMVREEITEYWVNKHQDDLRLQEVLKLDSLKPVTGSP